jgi:hypothetical protein
MKNRHSTSLFMVFPSLLFLCYICSSCSKQSLVKSLSKNGGSYELLGSPGQGRSITFSSAGTYTSSYFLTGQQEVGTWWLEEGGPEGDLAIMQSDAIIGSGGRYFVYALLDSKQPYLNWQFLGERTIANKNKKYDYTPTTNGSGFSMYPKNFAVAASKEYLTGGSTKEWPCSLTGYNSGLNPVTTNITFGVDGSIVADHLAGSGVFDGTFTLSPGNWYILYRAKNTTNIDVLYKVILGADGKPDGYTQSGYLGGGNTVYYDFNAPYSVSSAPHTLSFTP